MGDTNTAGGYAGIVSYLNTGTEAIETNSAMVFGASTDNKDQVDRSTAKIRKILFVNNYFKNPWRKRRT